MIRPTDFGFNEETAGDNVFQNHSTLSGKEVIQKAQQEFDTYVATLREKGVKVIVLDKDRIPELDSIRTPDAIFPNWFSTEPNGMVVLYRMNTRLRENEKYFLSSLEKAFYDEGFQVGGILSIGSQYDRAGVSLEGTGAMVFDRTNKVIFSGTSQRSNPEYINTAGRTLGYRTVVYETEMTNGDPFYHSDLYFCMGQKFAVVCLDAIKGDKREAVKQELTGLGKEIIEITKEQVEKSFCGNILEIKSEKDGKKYVIMSRKAYKGFTDEQLSKISKYAEVIAVDLDTIEEVGGGSAKCMLTECLLPRIPEKQPLNAEAHPCSSVRTLKKVEKAVEEIF
jgi:hypothetical protein